MKVKKPDLKLLRVGLILTMLIQAITGAINDVSATNYVEDLQIIDAQGQPIREKIYITNGQSKKIGIQTSNAEDIQVEVFIDGLVLDTEKTNSYNQDEIVTITKAESEEKILVAFDTTNNAPKVAWLEVMGVEAKEYIIAVKTIRETGIVNAYPVNVIVEESTVTTDTVEENQEVEENNSAPIEENTIETQGVVNSIVDLRIEDVGGIDLYTGETASFKLVVQMNGDNTVIENPKLVVRLPEEFVSSYKFSDLQGQISRSEKVENGYIIVTYELTTLHAGQYIAIPATVITHNGNTPNGYVLPITISIEDKNGKTYQGEGQEYTYKTIKKVVSKEVYGGNFAGAEDPNKPGFIDPASQAYVQFRFWLHAEVYKSAGNREATYTVTDKLPAEAVFDQDKNPDWIYNASTHEVTTTFTVLVAYGYGIPNLYLRFPGAEIGKDYTNEVKVKVTPVNMDYNEQEYEIESSVDFNLHADLPKINFKKTADKSNILNHPDPLSKEQGWSITFRNTVNTGLSDTNFYNFVLSDTLANTTNNPSDLKYSRIVLYKKNSSELNGTISVSYVNETGTEILLQENISLVNNNVELTIPEEAKQILIKADAGTYIAANGSIIVGVYTNFIDPNNPKNTNNKLNVTNSAKIEGNYGNGAKHSGESSASFRLEDYAPGIIYNKTSTGGTHYIDDVISHTIKAYCYGSVLKGELIDMQYIMDLLPEGLEYVPGSSHWSRDFAFAEMHGNIVNTEPTVIDNYQGTGRTALIWNITPYIMSKTVEKSTTNRVLHAVTFKTKITGFTKAGENRNETYMGLENPIFSQRSGTLKKDDIYDIDMDNNVTEKAWYASSVFQYQPPEQIVSQKVVKGDRDSSFTYSPRTGNVSIGGTAQYQLMIRNETKEEYDSLTMIEILPFVGDTTIIPNSNGDYENRNSTFPVQLTGPIQLPSGRENDFVVYYTTDIYTSDVKQYSQQANWITNISDYSQVKGVKIEMVSGKLGISEHLSFTVNTKVPANMSLTDADIANNSYATSIDGGNHFFESNAAGLYVQTYKVEGYIFKDRNKDGIKGDNEAVFANHKVTLLNSDGSIAKDVNGNEYQLITDATGYYSFKVVQEGDYQIKVENPDGYALTQYHDPDTERLGSHIPVNGNDRTVTNVFTLDRNQKEKQRNAGYYKDIAMAVNKTVMEIDGTKETDGTLISSNNKFQWNVYYTLGSNLSEIQNIVFTDTIHDYFEIEGIEIKDVTNKRPEDIMASMPTIDPTNYENNTTGNEIKIRLLPNSQGEYLDLEEKVYALCIQVRIKDSITLEQLKQISNQGGIPNQGKLVITDQSNENTIESNIPKVNRVDQAGKLEIKKNVYTEDGNTDLDGKIVQIGDIIRYDIMVYNPVAEPSEVRDIVVKDTIPRGLLLQADKGVLIDGINSSYQLDGQELEVSIGDLRGEESKTVSFYVAISEDADPKSVNVAKVEGKTTPPGESEEDVKTDPSNPVEIENAPTLEIEKTVDKNIVSKGDKVVYTIEITNGTKANGVLTNIQIVDMLPSGLTYVAGSLEVDGILQPDTLWNNNVLTYQHPTDLVGGGKIIIRYEVEVISDELGEQTNIVQGFGESSDGSQTYENTDEETIEVIESKQLEEDKEKPTAETKPDSGNKPVTGDKTNIVVLMTIFGFSIIGILCSVKKKQKYLKNNS